MLALGLGKEEAEKLCVCGLVWEGGGGGWLGIHLLSLVRSDHARRARLSSLLLWMIWMRRELSSLIDCSLSCRGALALVPLGQRPTLEPEDWLPLCCGIE